MVRALIFILAAFGFLPEKDVRHEKYFVSENHHMLMHIGSYCNKLNSLLTGPRQNRRTF